MVHTYTAVYHNTGEWWVGTVEEVPGAIAQERTLAEVRESLIEAVQLILEVNQAYAPPVPEDATIIREPLAVPA